MLAVLWAVVGFEGEGHGLGMRKTRKSGTRPGRQDGRGVETKT